MTALTEQDYQAAATDLGCDVAAIKAVADVESAGAGFGPDGRPKVLFEGHIFYAKTGGRFAQSHPHLSYKAWTKTFYPKTHEESWARLEAAKKLEPRAALLSTSWGKFQIMGFNHVACGFGSVEAFVAAMHAGEAAHLAAFVAFLKHRKLDVPLRAHDWPAFAKGYNGPAYAANKYDVKMAAAHTRHAAL